MENIGTGAGLGALGFWLFIAMIVVAGIWDNIRKREAQHETLRRAIESGQPLDDELVDKLLAITSGNKNLARDLKVSALILAFIAPGMALLGWFLSISGEPELFMVLLGVGALIGAIAIGLAVAASAAERWHQEDAVKTRTA